MEEIDSHSGSFHEEKGFLVVDGALDSSDTFDVKMLLNIPSLIFIRIGFRLTVGCIINNFYIHVINSF